MCFFKSTVHLQTITHQHQKHSMTLQFMYEKALAVYYRSMWYLYTVKCHTTKLLAKRYLIMHLVINKI